MSPTLSDLRRYAISRSLYIYVNKSPGQALPPAVREYLMYVLSREGQEVTVKAGFVALTTQMVTENRAKLSAVLTGVDDSMKALSATLAQVQSLVGDPAIPRAHYNNGRTFWVGAKATF